MRVKNKTFWGIIGASIVFVFVFPALTFKIVGPSPWGKGSVDAWINFFGAYFGGILSALGVFITLYYYTEKDKRDRVIERAKERKIRTEEKAKDEEIKRDELNKRQEEMKWRENERILSIRPYLTLRNAKTNEENQYPTVPYMFMPFQCGPEFPSLNTGKFVLSNEGLGIANDLSCSMSNDCAIATTYDCATTTTYGCAVTLPIGNKIIIAISQQDTVEDFDISFTFQDMFSNKYEQKMSVIVTKDYCEVYRIYAPILIEKGQVF